MNNRSIQLDIKTAPLGQDFTQAQLRNQSRAVYGGLAWPGKRPGFVVVLAIVRSQEPPGWEIYLLDEFESFDMRELIRHCGLMHSKYEPYMWVGDTTNDSAEEFMYEMRDDSGFYLSETDLMEMEPFYPYVLGKLKELLNPEHRRMFLKSSKVLSYMGEIESGEGDELERGDYPALEALTYAAVEALRMVENESAGPFPTHTGIDPDFEEGEYDHLLRPGATDPGPDEDEDDEGWYQTV